MDKMGGVGGGCHSSLFSLTTDFLELSACREMSAVIPINPVISLGFFFMYLFVEVVFEVWIIQGRFWSEQTMQDQSNQ